MTKREPTPAEIDDLVAFYRAEADFSATVDRPRSRLRLHNELERYRSGFPTDDAFNAWRDQALSAEPATDLARAQWRHIPVMKWLVARGVPVDTAAKAIVSIVNDVLEIPDAEREARGVRWRAIKMAYLNDRKRRG